MKILIKIITRNSSEKARYSIWSFPIMTFSNSPPCLIPLWKIILFFFKNKKNFTPVVFYGYFMLMSSVLINKYDPEILHVYEIIFHWYFLVVEEKNHFFFFSNHILTRSIQILPLIIWMLRSLDCTIKVSSMYFAQNINDNILWVVSV